MSIKDQLTQDMKTAMKAHDSQRLGVIRFLLAEIKNAEIDGTPSNDASLQKIITSQVKKAKDALADFTSANRHDLISAEQAKIDIMTSYLPKQLSDQDLEKIIKDTLATADPNLNQGQLIGLVIKQVSTQADGSRVSAMIKKLTS